VKSEAPWKEEPKGSLGDHLEALRRTLIRTLIIIGCCLFLSLIFHKELFSLLKNSLGEGRELVILSPTEGLASLLKFSFWLSLSASSPFWLYSLAAFISPGLRSHEKRLLLPFIALSLALFALGALFAAVITLPLSNSALYSFNSSFGTNLWSLSQYLDYSILLILGHGLAFEAWLILGFTVHYGLISAATLVKKRGIVVVITLLAAALLTPPDILTQLLLAAPLLLLYELSILYGKWRESVSSKHNELKKV